MTTYAETNRVFFTKTSREGNKVMLVKSQSNPDIKYTVDVTNGRCSCPAWVYSRTKEPCKHLRKLGFHEVARPRVPVQMDLLEPKHNREFEELVFTEYL